MTFPKCIQVLLLLVLFCLSTSCCGRRVLADHTSAEQPNSARLNPAAMTGVQGCGGGIGSGGCGGGPGGGGPCSGFGGDMCGDGQPWYQPPVGGWGGCYAIPVPISCPIGWPPAHGSPGSAPMATHKMHHLNQREPQSAHVSGHGPSFETTNKQQDSEQEEKEKQDFVPENKEKQDSEPRNN